MKLIIDISDDAYDSIMSKDWKNAGWLYSEEWKAIHDGKPFADELQEIRQEIDEKISHYDHFTSSYTANGLTMAKEIIDKHLSDIGGTE